MLIGYARVSSDDQNLNLQKDALTRAGCERILEDRQSGAKADRPGLRDALDYARDGDTLMVWRLDRLSRSLKDLIDLVSQLEARGIGLKSLHESIDTTSSSGKLIFHVFGALAEFERNLIRERTQAGLAAARARGRKGERLHALSKAQVRLAQAAMAQRDTKVSELCLELGVTKATISRVIDDPLGDGVKIPYHQQMETDAIPHALRAAEKARSWSTNSERGVCMRMRISSERAESATSRSTSSCIICSIAAATAAL